MANTPSIGSTERIIKVIGCLKVISPGDVIKQCPCFSRHYPRPVYGPIAPEQYDGKYLYCEAINTLRKVYLGFKNVKELFMECPLLRENEARDGEVTH